jgi:hypothetical protein
MLPHARRSDLFVADVARLRSEHDGPPLCLGFLPGVRNTVDLQSGRVEQGQQTTLLAQLKWWPQLASRRIKYRLRSGDIALAGFVPDEIHLIG